MRKLIILGIFLFSVNLFAQERIVTSKGICSVNEECFELINLIPESRIIVNSPKKESKMVIQENVWAAPQIVITVSAPTSQEAAAIITKEGDILITALLEAERNRNIQNAKKYEEKALRAIVTQKFGGSPFFPKGYNLRKETEDFVWISYETNKTNQGILIYNYPYTDSTDFLLENLINKRNDILLKNVPGELENTYMTTNMLAEHEPGMSWVKYKKRDFIELRGLWEVQNDFMGGPFVDHIFLDKEKKNIIVLEAFVYAPSYDKRNYLRQVESIIYSFEFF